ncbi:MAG TPA: GNAT family N-acetyltransferase [Pyrinomonadaceae bacterium]|nr:GNAT family N-acetyltransferase [Pyrinomonadaceae bacterium]
MSLKQAMQSVMEETAYLPPPDVTLTVTELSETETNEALAFLSERPIHTVCMIGLIRDNGLVSEYNRGTFYGCRNSEGRLEGVALIGHATLVETRTRGALRELALVAQIHSRLHMIMAEQETVEEFWNNYADHGQPMRFACRELLFELRNEMETRGEVEGLRLATLDDLHLVAPVHAAMAEAESGINPLEVDREGFLQRCARRIGKNRVWVMVEDDRLIFKADVQAETPDLIYLEGVYVNPLERGTGLARRCFNQLCKMLLTRTRSICLLANEENEKAHAFYRLCGFRCVSKYDTIFLKREDISKVIN